MKSEKQLWDAKFNLLPGVTPQDLMICNDKVCWWAKCAKDIANKCPAHVWAKGKYRILNNERKGSGY